MPETSASFAFPFWRDLWVALDGVPPLLAEADAALRRRAVGNQRMPRLEPADNSEAHAVGIRWLRAWAQDKASADKPVPMDIARIGAIVQPALRAAAWARWLFLERAFLDGSVTGDLLFSALALRTMCEEVLRLHALDLDTDRLAFSVASGAAQEQERLKLFLSVAWTSLDGLPQDMILEGKDWPSLKLVATAMRRLERVRVTLNSYVHPNYGSHIAALFPESASAALLLLEGVVAVYEAFFALSWAELPVPGHTVPTGIGPLESWSGLLRRFQSHTLPEVRRTAGNPALAEEMRVPKLIEWLTTKRDDLEAMLRDPAAAPLVKGLPRWAADATSGDEASRYRMWDGATAIDVLKLAFARRAEQLLADEFPLGAPRITDQIPWLRFNALSLQLAMLLDQVKAAAFKMQLVRQITQGNSLGALLCVRSLIEHRALAVWLPREVSVSLNALVGELRAANPLPKDAREVARPLVRFLSAQAMESKEMQRSWIVDEGGARLNLRSIVEGAFPKDVQFRTHYALASAAVHGRIERGRDLVVNAGRMRMHARFLALLVLERICDLDEEMDHLSVALTQFVRLEHAATFGGTYAAGTDAVVRQAFGRIEGVLASGVDYTGEGTAQSPYRLAAHLEFVPASYALLRQAGVDVTTCPRVLDRSLAGCLCDRWQAPDRDYWFQISLPS